MPGPIYGLGVLVDPERLMGRAEIRARLGVSITRIKQLIARPDFPRPIRELTMGKLWDGDQVEAWIAKHRQQIAEEPEGE